MRWGVWYPFSLPRQHVPKYIPGCLSSHAASLPILWQGAKGNPKELTSPDLPATLHKSTFLLVRWTETVPDRFPPRSNGFVWDMNTKRMGTGYFSAKSFRRFVGKSQVEWPCEAQWKMVVPSVLARKAVKQLLAEYKEVWFFSKLKHPKKLPKNNVWSSLSTAGFARDAEGWDLNESYFSVGRTHFSVFYSWHFVRFLGFFVSLAGSIQRSPEWGWVCFRWAHQWARVLTWCWLSGA